MNLDADCVVSWSESSAPAGITLEAVYIGPDPHGLGGFQVAVASAATPPSRQVLRELFTARRGRTQVQLVVAVTHADRAYLFGPDPQAQAIDLPLEQAQRQLQSVLSEPDVLAATERITGFRKAHDSTAIPGFINSGLFATHHLTRNVPTRPDWAQLNETAAGLLSARGRQLIDALGFRCSPASGGAYILSSATDAPRAVAVLLDDSEQFDAKSARFQLSPVAYGLAVAQHHELPWMVVLRKDQIRLYPGRVGVGVGSKGQAETYFEIDLSTVDAGFAGLLPLIFSAEALAPDGTTDQLLHDSTRYATELGVRLRERVYENIVPPIAVEVAQQLAKRGAVKLDAEGLATAYRVALHILFRLLFQAYAEDRGLLPSGRNEGFDANSLKTNASRLVTTEITDFSDAATIWLDLVQVWNAIDHGNPLWQIPSYNGGLFSTDAHRSPEGALITQIEIPDNVLGPALKHLLIDTSTEGVEGAVDFRSLSVREFGTIYEGLLASSLSMAEQNLTLNADGAWIPALEGDEVVAPVGTIYFHTASGERKATGSYFTKKILVDHLVDRSVVPTLTAHLAKIEALLRAGDAATASRCFFDFRVVDLAMGSGHFLVAAVDKIEAMMRTFLTQHTVPGVSDELLRLAAAAKDALGSDDVAKSEVEEIGLLRRQVARRCIYGLDLNPMAVELSRLALWIHTFIPGLPMSNLDHGLVHANSLTGIGAIQEALDALIPQRPRGQATWCDDVLNDELAAARTLLHDVAAAGEANKSEVEEGALRLQEARAAADTARRIFDAAIATRLGAVQPENLVDEVSLRRLLDRPEIAESADRLQSAHLPYLFPEVFLSDNPGFDVLLGNPPWDKVRWEAAPFWARVSPGLMALPAAERDARIAALRAERPVEATREQVEMAERQRLQEYFRTAFSWRGGTHLELAQLMLERAMMSVRPSGAVGLVLPRQSLVLSGWRHLRRELFARHDATLVQARNNGGWIFEDLDPRYAIVLLSAVPATDSPIEVAVVTSPAELQALTPDSTIQLTRKELAAFSDSMAVPWFATPADKRVFDRLRAFPRLSGDKGWMQGTHDARWDFTGTGPDRALATTARSPNAWSIMMTRHVDPFALRNVAARQHILDLRALAGKKRGVSLDASGMARVSDEHPVVLFRYPSTVDNTRTLIAAALPRTGWLHNKGYVHAVAHSPGTPAEHLLALIGLLNTSTEDWWARRFVDRHVTAPVINNLPLPDLGPDALAELAGRTAVLMHRSGYRELAGGIDVADMAERSAYAGLDRDHLLAGLEAEVARGFGLNPDDLAVIRQDFSDQGMPAHVFDLACEFLAAGEEVAP